MTPLVTYLLTITIIILCSIAYIQHKELKILSEKFESIKREIAKI